MFLTFLGCLHLCGGHLGVMQCIAWTKMLVSYSQEKGLATGIRETFDGNHPCPLCHAIDEQRKREQQQPDDRIPARELSKLERYFTELDVVAIPSPPAGFEVSVLWPATESWASWGGSAPPTPPPRSGGLEIWS